MTYSLSVIRKDKKVTVYSTVTVKFDHFYRSYTLVRSSEVDLSRNEISIEAPLGKALLNRKINDLVEIEAPAGTVKLKTAAWLVPESVTSALVPGAPVTVVPTAIVAAVPVGPGGPWVPPPIVPPLW